MNDDATFTLDEDNEQVAAWLSSLGLDPETATIDDLYQALDARRTARGAKP